MLRLAMFICLHTCPPEQTNQTRVLISAQTKSIPLRHRLRRIEGQRCWLIALFKCLATVLSPRPCSDLRHLPVQLYSWSMKIMWHSWADTGFKPGRGETFGRKTFSGIRNKSQEKKGQSSRKKEQNSHSKKLCPFLKFSSQFF